MAVVVVVVLLVVLLVLVVVSFDQERSKYKSNVERIEQ